MKRLIIVIAFAGLMAGCARHTETDRGGGGSYDTGGSMGAGTNGTTINPGTGGTQGGTGNGTQGGTTDPGKGGTGTDTGNPSGGDGTGTGTGGSPL